MMFSIKEKRLGNDIELRTFLTYSTAASNHLRLMPLASANQTKPNQHPLIVARTSGVPEVFVGRGVVFAEALQDQLVVHEAVQRAQEEDVEWQVADLLQLKVTAQRLQPPRAPARPLQLQQGLGLLLQVTSHQLGPKQREREKEKHREDRRKKERDGESEIRERAQSVLKSKP